MSAHRRRRARTRRGLALLVAAVIGSAPGPAWTQAEDPAPPVIERVMPPAKPRVGAPGEIGLAYRAARANVVAVIQTVEDLDGPVLRRATRQREIGVVSRAFGREAGELALPLGFLTAGRKRVTLVLVTDEREESDPAVVELEVAP